MISTRGRYALRVLADMAEVEGNPYIPLKDIVARQDVSQKYVEGIMTTLSKAGLVDAVHGKGGGYRLVKKPEEYTVGEVLRLTENNGMAPVACVANGAEPCERQGSCRTYPMWNKLNQLMSDYLDSVTLKDLIG